MNKRFHVPGACLVLVLAVCSVPGASAEGMEERLRAQLRSTTQQLQALQSEQAQAAAARADAQGQLEAAQAQVKQLIAELAKAKVQVERLGGQQEDLRAQAREQAASSNERVGQYKQAYDDLLVLARGKEAERAALQASLAQRDDQVQQCVARNRQMYDIAKEILDAYEKIDVRSVMKIRQPFAGSARVKFEELAQVYGDELYKTQVDVVPVPPQP